MVNFVILCGGAGSRLWPKSREKLPKQLLALTNDSTMLQNTVQRLCFLKLKMNTMNKLVIICNKEHAHIVELQLSSISLPMEYKIVSEPVGRDSAPAICISALLGEPSDYTFVLPCDHVMDEEEFAKCCLKSLDYLENSIVTFGVEPTHPETGYGYIQTNDKNETLKFVEKPNLETAKYYLEQGSYLWNAGIFAFKNANMISCFEKYAPDILENASQTVENTNFVNLSITLSSQPFSTCRAISVDYAIMEKLCSDPDQTIKTNTFPYQSYWNDIGSYLALYQQLEKDENNNVLKGDVFTLDTTNSYIESGEKMVATIGIHDLIIVNTEDALLVCNNEKTQDVKKIVEYLKKEKREEYILHKKVFRPWGYYINVEGNDHSGFKIKRIAVYPGKRLSLQSHNRRSEHWVIAKGKAKVQVGNEEFILEKDQHIYIPLQALHRIENVGSELMEFTETQIGDYLGEDDIVRYEDDFGRT
jgi:mannose-1-phosphate guanylyltransferase/mannose-1-phosphate guanylyltransferase/mannose-6-phosphate isomerase